MQTKNKSLKTKKNRGLITLFFLIGCTTAWSQISEGGLPPSRGIPSLRSSVPPVEAPVDFNVEQLLEEDAEWENLGMPPRCAKVIPADIRFEDRSEKITLPNGQTIRRLEISAPGALAILLYYDRFVIPEGGKLFIYDPAYTRILGAYSHKTNSKRTEFATEFVSGDKLVLEYVESPSGENPQIRISGIAYGYNHLRRPAGDNRLKSRWDSESCMININCPEGDNWQDQKKGVARIVTLSGGYASLCSGTLVNNTNGDFDPLFLSAHHCYESLTPAQMNQSIYYFHYEWQGCENLNTAPRCPTMVGAQMLADIDIEGGSDGALLRLNDSIPQDYGVYFNGWDRRDIAATAGVGIHHPAGDVKKISTFSNTAASDTWRGEERGADFAHWNVHFTRTTSGHSVTEGGSSGSPLFNQNGLLVGTLTGGNSSCLNKTGDNLYGKLWYHWDRGPQKMNRYLDPVGANNESLEGTYLNYDETKARFYPKEKTVYATQQIEFFNHSRNAHTWEWTFEGGEPAVSLEENPPLVAFNSPGIHTVSLTVNKGAGNEHTQSMDIPVILKENICTDAFTIGNGTASSQFPLGSSQRQALSSAIYTAEELNLNAGAEISQIAWNAGAANPKTRTLSVYLKETDDVRLSANTWQTEIQGATLVYESAGDWTNEAGWVTVTLPVPFPCSGNKNLKILVRSVSAAGGGNASAACYYSEATQQHQQWISYRSTVPSDPGTVNDYRPDVRLTTSVLCGVAFPVAGFHMRSLNETETGYYAGDTIAFTSLSTGPVVNWQWSFPGASQESSREENPIVSYPHAGTYTASLTVSNHLGSNTYREDITLKERDAGEVGIRPLQPAQPVRTYPNPADKSVRISSPSPIEKITVQDIRGNVVRTVDAEKQTEITLPVSNWRKGIYILKVQTGTTVSNHKIIKK